MGKTYKKPEVNATREVKERKTSNSNYDLVHLDFVNGMELHLAAQKHNTPLNTAWGWYTRYGWRADREAQVKKLSERIFEKNAELACDVVRIGLENAKEFAEYVSEELQHLRLLRIEDQRDSTFDTFGKYLPKYTALAKMANLAGNYYKTYSPEVGADVAQKLLDSIEKEKKKGKDGLGTDAK